MKNKLFIIFAAIFICSVVSIGCDLVSGSDENGGPGELNLSGAVENYGGSAYNLRAPMRFEDLGDGQIDEDGSFEATLWAGDKIDDALHALGEGSTVEYRPFPCTGEEDFMITDSDTRFAHVVDLIYGPDGSSLALTDQTEGKIKRSYPRIDFGEIRIMWVYADRSVQINGECEQSWGSEVEQHMVDLDLDEGWNEVIYDHLERNDLKVTQGARPNSVNWYTDLGL